MNSYENPWQILRSDLKYENPWISLTEHQVLNPAGNPGIYGVVRFKNLAIGVLPIFPDKSTVLVGQYRFPLEAYSWEIVEGGGKHGVPPHASAERELLEETGLRARNLKEILRMHLSNSVSDELGIIYIAWNLTAGRAEPDETEQLAYKRVGLYEAYQMVLRGEITDSLSVAALLRVQIMETEGTLNALLAA